ncbi:evolutionarily conserved signaling intermediate in Toll pathway, mitochondrial isoform X1 [Manis pentadactyla]|uniref:evolutionarily conserved signaling intermediate in Toll pathway, mitochondrial isoform X1 n=1 Tax=Manis pentadactyla TaxID=143292 RepID=UPI00255CF407|nr:evolutionarily conserved signaling intermediate in Toll pathway, mitochondrial isoform X1 [Manis pentadactyla]XP_036739502.2 evolutionarily conserved signaling intermediate in Toll pathway, mitochondrial isoform X1 [Manis pentadactyla]XP_036739503.2 evolutionarily conserved signaling intermediate in Toll pathway, mitochondrial isoform X1 [Manis pentadactyla]XP_036739504.2 evolutionarily conserved signaling intermediate in Toll pathway, mitochondrial isoform X1 [Manis pentadactyla]XP_03673950
MRWAQAILLARGLARGWGGLRGAALPRAPFAQVPPQASQGLHCSSVSSNSEWSLVPRPPEPPRRLTKTLAPHEELFRQASDGARDKASFVQAVQNFGQYSVHKRGHVDFIYLALRKMREYGVERDLAVYNLLLDIFPKEVFRPRNFFQSVFIHYPRQQECGIAVLEQMENHGVMPNEDTEFLLVQIFGRKSYPMLKFVRMKLWFSRFKNINPFPIPRDLPQDPVDLARLGLRHMEPDLSARVTIYQEGLGAAAFHRCSSLQMPLPTDSSGAADPCEPHIVGIQSPDQQAALAHHNPARPLFVEGPFSLWLRDKCVYYHVLRADLLPPEEREVEEIPEEWSLYYPVQLDLDYERSGWDDYEFDIDKVEEGPIFAICMAGAHDQATLAKWIRGLQETNPALAQIPVVFRLAGSTGELLASSSGLEEPPSPPPEGQEEEEDNQQHGQS